MDAPFVPAVPDTPSPPGYRDRSTGLQVFGVIQLVMGALVLLGIPLILLGAIMSRRMTGAAMPLGTYFLGAMNYGVIAVILITLGIGSIRTRRWAWALTLVLSWIWLAGGIMGTILITAILPSAFASGFRRAATLNPSAGELHTGIVAAILTFVIVLLAVFLVVLPLIFVLFYRRKDVEDTCKHRDPVERWTDRCPLPVLAASLLFACGAAYYLLMSFTTPMVPFFGKYLTGIPGAIGCLTHGMIDAVLAIWFFRKRLLGWWIAIALLVLQAISAAVTFSRGDLLQAYSRMGWKSAQLQAMSDNPMLRGHLMLWWSLLFILLYIGYLVWVKRYLVAPPVHANPLPVADSPHHELQ